VDERGYTKNRILRVVVVFARDPGPVRQGWLRRIGFTKSSAVESICGLGGWG